jgi:VanZ family protein
MCLAYIAYATLSPLAARPTLVASSGLEHVAAFALLGGLFYLAYPKHLIFVLAIVLGSAVVLEFAQLLTPDRHGTVIDALQKLAGGGLGVLVTSTLFRLRVKEQ